MDWAARRRALVEALAESDRIDDERVLTAIESVPRHEFVPEQHRERAYDDRPLPIGDGQTISAPHMVAIMADLLELAPDDRVLEIGTGCGYHAAVTAELADTVYSVEYHATLAETARERLANLGYDTVAIRAGDGRGGWPEHAPYDRAYLTCGPVRFPRAVVEQLRPGGVVLGPLGRRPQTLVRARKRADGELEREHHGSVRFVTMQ
ncbi:MULTISPECIES: protein-L-isoaspartate(D-aspartate) O-methyltransferase [Halomicrobium]|uniref:Protein-L-isoaspartate O-methyltransferase n=2 Tax=Halomicrobium mukohataei TaxID=57705 RepID=C7NYJ8_HALMD|nr:MULTISPECIES: protein-L-isoaspartate(D-aspartate) O-methyltransferase [Halomicrobium]ACV46659.1 protein-L-isoaspartate O-methyltransferase [Halomicrobium mukohataei DSM 12286]QCD65169.1 protein-L-isoaspartate(D-aspartate) O-methyltransferase [Halomicrobium mukohataei]QFR19975.1 protein-L-isoaspartate(D-aspartate) O-methyltransferase [Halomicrobium sp. ZPS1]